MGFYKVNCVTFTINNKALCDQIHNGFLVETQNYTHLNIQNEWLTNHTHGIFPQFGPNKCPILTFNRNTVKLRIIRANMVSICCLVVQHCTINFVILVLI